MGNENQTDVLSYPLRSIAPSDKQSWFHVTVSLNSLIRIFSDGCALLISVLVAFAVMGETLIPMPIVWRISTGLFFIFSSLSCLYVFGLYDSQSTRGGRSVFKFLENNLRMSICLIISTIATEVWIIILDDREIAGFTVILFGSCAWFILGLWHLVYQEKAFIWTKRKKIFVLGNFLDSNKLAAGLKSTRLESPYELTGHGIFGRGSSVFSANSLTSNDIEDLSAAARKADADVIAHNELIYDLGDQVEDIQNKGFEVEKLSNIWEKGLGRLPQTQAVLLPDLIKKSRLFYEAGKRLLDVVAGLAGFFFFLLIILPVALAIKINSRGPLFYSQVRCGKNGQTFKLLKFRTMIQNAERDGPRWADSDDPRITRVGRFLRKSHLDEVPQFINVLRGELSLVGPRPERPEFMAYLTQHVPFFCYRNLVRPGITGWAQISGEYSSSVEDAKQKTEFDFFYLKKRCFLLDLVILLKTAKEVCQMRGQ